MANQCEHGSLARQCLMCELKTENERLRAELLEAARREADLIRRYLEWDKDDNPLDHNAKGSR